MPNAEGGPQGSSDYPAPTTFSGLIANSLRLYRMAPGQLIGLFVVLGIVDLGLRFGSLVAAQDGSRGVELTFGLIIPVVIAVTFSSLGMAIAGVLMADRLVGKQSSAREVMRGLPLQEVLAAGLFASIVSLLLAVLVGPLITLILPMLFGPPIVIMAVGIEHERMQTGLSRARSLLRGNAGRLFGALLAVVLGISLLSQMALGSIGVSTESLADTPQLAVILTVSIFVQALLYPYLSAAGLIAYLDARTRNENYGPEELAAELGV